MSKEDTKRDDSCLGFNEFRTENDEDRACGFLPCCHVKNDSVMNCWNFLIKGWQLRNHCTTNGSFESVVKDNRVNETTAQEEADGESVLSVSPSMPPLTGREQEILHCILNEVAVTDDEKKVYASDQGGNSILLRLTIAAVKLAQVATVTESQEQPASFFDVHDDDNAASVIQQFLKVAKRNEAIKLAQLKHLESVQSLVNKYTLLIQPLELYVKATMSSSCPIERMTLLLGQGAPSSTLTCLWDAVDLVGSEDKLYRLMKTCLHLAVAHTFLTCRHHDVTQQLGSAILEASSDHEHNDRALRAMCQAFVDFLRKKTPNGSILEREHFSEWQNHHVPGLVSALPLFMRALLFPSLGEEGEEKTLCLFPTLYNDSPSTNTHFSISSGPLSSWLFLISSSFPIAYRHKTVGSAVCH